MRRQFVRTFLFVTGIITCPCLSIPLLVAVLSGTVGGAWLSSHLGLVTGLVTGYFLAAVGLALFLELHTPPPASLPSPKEPDR